MTGTPDITTPSQDMDAPELYLFAFRTDPDVTEPELFTLFVYGDVERPLTLDDRILFFARPELGRCALDEAGLAGEFPGPPPLEVSLVCDVAAALHLVAHADEDTDSALLNCVNTLLDMVAATQLAVPEELRDVMHALADHLTFDRDLAGFFAERELPRLAAQDALLWSIGAVTARARVLR